MATLIHSKVHTSRKSLGFLALALATALVSAGCTQQPNQMACRELNLDYTTIGKAENSSGRSADVYWESLIQDGRNKIRAVRELESLTAEAFALTLRLQEHLNWPDNRNAIGMYLAELDVFCSREAR